MGGVMQADSADNPPQGSNREPEHSCLWERIKYWDSQFSVAKGLTLVTLLTGFVGGYFQYLNAYEDKVGADAKEDMTAATSTFEDVSNTFAEAQMLQQIIYFDLKDVLSDASDAGDKAMTTKKASDVYPE